MKAYDNGRIDLNKPMSKYFAPLRNTDKKSLTIKEALLHETGMPASLQMTSVIIDPNSFTKPLIKRRKSSIYSIQIGNNTFANRNAQLRKDLLSSRKSDRFPMRIAQNLYCLLYTSDAADEL